MAWTLAILFIIAALLLIYSLIKLKQSSMKEQREIDTIYLSMVKEMDELRKQVRNLELDIEIIAQQSTSDQVPSNERILLRELLDLYKRGYSVQGIAAEKQLNESEVERLLTPFFSAKNERSSVANEC